VPLGRQVGHGAHPLGQPAEREKGLLGGSQTGRVLLLSRLKFRLP